jgi:hypothetical protein
LLSCVPPIPFIPPFICRLPPACTLHTAHTLPTATAVSKQDKPLLDTGSKRASRFRYMHLYNCKPHIAKALHSADVSFGFGFENPLP